MSLFCNFQRRPSVVDHESNDRIQKISVPSSERKKETYMTRRRKTAFVVLCRDPGGHAVSSMVRDALSARCGLDVFVVSDSPLPVPGSGSKLPRGATVLAPSDEECAAEGFTNSCIVTISKPTTAWDKALYSFCRGPGRDHDFVWFLEDDVFVPGPSSVRAIDGRHGAGGTADLVVASHHAPDPADPWHWGSAESNGLPKPWFKSMVCAAGVGRRVLDDVDRTARERGRLHFIEYFFNSIAARHRLVVETPTCLRDIHFQLPHPRLVRDRLERKTDAVNDGRLCWYHPVKCSDEYASLHASVAVDWPVKHASVKHASVALASDALASACFILYSLQRTHARHL